MKKACYIIVLFITLAGCNAQHKKNVEVVPPAAFEQKMVADKGQVIDVRTPKEYEAGHLANAVNIHLYDKDFEQRTEKLDKQKPVYVYCKVGGRSAEAVDIMHQKGFKNIIELQGGMDAWLEAGKSVKK